MTATFGEYIKQRRTELGFPLKKVASHLDIDISTLGKIEREERNLSEKGATSYGLRLLDQFIRDNYES